MPRPGTPLIHPLMVGRVQAIAQDAMTDACQISRGGTRVFDAATMRYTAQNGAETYSGPCRIQPVPTRDHVIDAGGDLVTLRRYSVSVPAAVTDVAVDDHITFTTTTDPLLTGRVLRVNDVTGGTHEGQRHLMCFDDLG